jgi:hypothetical protein
MTISEEEDALLNVRGVNLEGLARLNNASTEIGVGLDADDRETGTNVITLRRGHGNLVKDCPSGLAEGDDGNLILRSEEVEQEL